MGMANLIGGIFFGPGDRSKPTYRFDSPTGSFGVLYIAPALDGAVIETLLRSPQQRMVSRTDIEKRAVSKLEAGRPMRLVKAHGCHLSMIGATSALFTGRYDHCREWSDALFLHPDAPDGILYPSRHNPDAFCIALSERRDVLLATTSTTPLMRVPQVFNILNRHGKSVSHPPFP